MGCRYAELSQHIYELQQVSVGGFFHGSCLSEVTTSCCNTVLILVVAKKKLKVNNGHLYFRGWRKVEKKCFGQDLNVPSLFLFVSSPF
jgi:hypothetical protein